MNKILISRDKIVSDSSLVEIKDNVIKLMASGIYMVEYQDVDTIGYSFVVMNGIDVILLESSCLNNIVVNNRYVVDNSNLVVNKFYDNVGVSEDINIELYNYGKINYKFSNICKNEEFYNININHNGVGTVSNISNKSIAMDGSKLDFVINSIVKKEYVKSTINQNTRIVTIGNCDCKVSPNMFIDCDDIEARHGSVIGTFKDDMVFYLMSRGIDYNNAMKLLVKGYLFSNIDIDSELRDKIFNSIDTYWR